jgi:hypothetical protein
MIFLLSLSFLFSNNIFDIVVSKCLSCGSMCVCVCKESSGIYICKLSLCLFMVCG